RSVGTIPFHHGMETVSLVAAIVLDSQAESEVRWARAIGLQMMPPGWVIVRYNHRKTIFIPHTVVRYPKHGGAIILLNWNVVWGERYRAICILKVHVLVQSCDTVVPTYNCGIRSTRRKCCTQETPNTNKSF